jgi:hypothetical protein
MFLCVGACVFGSGFFKMRGVVLSDSTALSRTLHVLYCSQSSVVQHSTCSRLCRPARSCPLSLLDHYLFQACRSGEGGAAGAGLEGDAVFEIAGPSIAFAGVDI